MVLTLKEALSDDRTLNRLMSSPETFKFQDEVHLIIGTMHSPPDMYVTSQDPSTGQVFTANGPIFNLVELLAKEINFTYTLFLPPDGKWGAPINGSWTGLVRQVHEEEIDMSAGAMCITSGRVEVVDFVRSVVNPQTLIVLSGGNPDIDPWGFLMPFTPSVWLGFAISLFMIWIVKLLLERRPENGSQDYISWGLETLFEYITVYLNQGLNLKKEKTQWKRCLLGSWMMLVTILFMGYNSSLISLLSTRFFDRSVQSLGDLIQHPSLTFVVEKDTSFMGIIESSTSGTLLEAKNLQEKDRFLYVANQELVWVLENLVRKGTHGLLHIDEILNKMLADDFTRTGRCDYYIARESMLGLNCGPIVKKGNPILHPINARLAKLEGSGLYSFWREQNLANYSSCKNPPSKIIVQEAFSLSTLWGMFVVFATGLILSTLSFLIEVMMGRVCC